jgi:hypothetical protein
VYASSPALLSLMAFDLFLNLLGSGWEKSVLEFQCGVQIGGWQRNPVIDKWFHLWGRGMLHVHLVVVVDIGATLLISMSILKCYIIFW